MVFVSDGLFYKQQKGELGVRMHKQWGRLDVTSVAPTPVQAWDHGNNQQLQWLKQDSQGSRRLLIKKLKEPTIECDCVVLGGKKEWQ